MKRKSSTAIIDKICWQIIGAALMQPFQNDSHCPAAKDKSITHAAVAPSNLDAAITMRSATRESTYAKRSRTHEQPLIAEHRGGTDSTLKRLKPHPSHTGGSFHRRPKPLYTEKRKVSCSGFPPNTSPMQHSCSHYTATCNQRVNICKEITHTWATISLQNIEEERFDLETTAAAPVAHRR